MKKIKEIMTNNTNVFAIAIFVIIGGICGFFGGIVMGRSLKQGSGGSEALLMFVWFVVALYLAMFLQIVIHEGGHFLFGKISGYKFCSFRIGSLMLIFDKGKYKWKKFNIAGTGGQCLMTPPEGDGYEYPYLLYNLGGSITNSIVGILSLMIYFIVPHNAYLTLFLLTLFILGIAFALMNAIPLKIAGMANDGLNAFSLGKDRQARHAFWLQLYINGLIASGTRLRDQPSHLFELPEDIDYTNTLNCSLGVMRCNYLQDIRQFEESKLLSEYMIEHAPGTLEIQKNELRCELLYFEMLGECRQDEIERMYTKKVQKYIKITSSYVSRKRLLYAYEVLVMKSVEGAKKQLEAFEKTAKTYPYSAEIEGEREQIEFINQIADLRKLDSSVV